MACYEASHGRPCWAEAVTAYHKSQSWPAMVGIGQKEAASEKGSKTPRGRSENVGGAKGVAKGSLRRRSVQKHHAGAAKTDAKIAYPVPAMQGSQFVVFLSLIHI